MARLYERRTDKPVPTLFQSVAGSGPRIDMNALQRNARTLPTDPAKQNALWYRGSTYPAATARSTRQHAWDISTQRPSYMPVCLNSGRRMELLVDRRSCIAELLFAAVIGPGNSYRNNALLRV